LERRPWTLIIINLSYRTVCFFRQLYFIEFPIVTNGTVMKTINRPFEGILGNTKELRVLERLIASPRVEFNPTDLGRMTGVSRESAIKTIEKLTEWNILQFIEHKGNMDFYKLNEEEPMVLALKAFNDSIIIRMFPEVSDALEEMENGRDLAQHKVVYQNGPFVSSTIEPCSVNTYEGRKASQPVEIARAW
jgi:hypothetical protein